jgi:phospholipid-binding lipoprotein MlaA
MKRRTSSCAPVWLPAVLILGLVGCAGTDPWERMNRGTFWFNEKADNYVLEPAAKGWDWALPDTAQTGLRNFFANLSFPVHFVNNLLQLKPLDAGEDLSRFLVNTTVGVLGFVDVASKIDVPKNDEDFGQTLGSYGVPAGPYLVLPLLGPSSARDAPSLVVDGATQPLTWVLPFAVNAGLTGTETINLRAYYLEEVDQARRDAFDFYIFRRDAFLDNREHRVSDRDPEEAESDEDEELYFPEEEEIL